MINNALKTLLAVNETKSITKAAEMLNFTQPAVSQHIKRLEAQYGVKIFVRSEKGLKITPEGEIIVQYATRILNLYNAIPSSLKEYNDDKLQLTVGLSQTTSQSVMSEVLAKYCKENPGAHIKIIFGSITELYKKLKNYEVSLIVIDGNVDDPDVRSFLLDTDHLICAVHNDNPLSKQDCITLEQLKKENLILKPDNSSTREMFEKCLEQRGETLAHFNVSLEVDSVATIKELVKRNLGVAILAKSVCFVELQRNRFKAMQIQNMSMPREVNMVYLDDFQPASFLKKITQLYYSTKEEVMQRR